MAEAGTECREGLLKLPRMGGDMRTAKVHLELKLAINIKVSVPPALVVKEQMRKM